jgi:arylsulfatase A-like enzyme
MNELNDINPAMPFLLYYVPGGTHSPHHQTPEWTKKISDMHLFDDGWNALRDKIFANQKKLRVVPQDAALTPWPKDILKEWDQLTPVEKKLFIRQADVYGAYLAYTDHEIGRVIQAVGDIGKLDNTLIIYISGDNGSSAEGSPTGTFNVPRHLLFGRQLDAVERNDLRRASIRSAFLTAGVMGPRATALPSAGHGILHVLCAWIPNRHSGCARQ